MKNNEDLSYIVKSVDYSDHSIFNVIFCDSKIKADECLSFIQNSLEKLDNNKNFISVFKNRKINLDNLYLDLHNLITNNSYKKNDFLILELTFLELDKIYEIEHLFLKMNQLRNSIMNLHLPILLLIPRRLKKYFMVCAPDFWSIRSVDIEIKSEITITKENKDYSYEELEHKDKLSFLLNEYHRLKSVNSEISKYLLMIKSGEIGDFYLKHISIEEANKYYKESSKISYEILGKREDSVEAKRDVSVGLNKLANVYIRQGELSFALENYKKSLDLRYEILGKREDSVEAKRDLCVGLVKISNKVLYEDYQANKKQILGYLNEAKEIANNNLGQYDFDEINSIIDGQINELRDIN